MKLKLVCRLGKMGRIDRPSASAVHADFHLPKELLPQDFAYLGDSAIEMEHIIPEKNLRVSPKNKK